ncbi:MAG: type II toxin-antitoxin system HicA family toxin [Nitrospirae bacterium]|nr:type II toxin-antitoxin system HicA family toxin [Nitrospirota bacterium]
MSKLANISGKDTVKTFKKFGWQIVGKAGSHVVMTKEGVRVNLSIPQHNQYCRNLMGFQNRTVAHIRLRQHFVCRQIQIPSWGHHPQASFLLLLLNYG